MNTPSTATIEPPKKTSPKGSKRKATKAELADKYDLYQQSVQEPEHEVEFFDRVFKERFGRAPKLLREDFCGTFSVCCEWAKLGEDREAVGVDLDPEPLEWGKANNLTKLSAEQQSRVTLLEEDVRHVAERKADVLAAQNFSFWLFKTRPELVAYFKQARANLAEQGVMVLDMMGGPECLEENHEDIRKYKGFKYVWGQDRFDPITCDSSHYISFRFKDGSALERCFEYHWRFWSIPEVRELLTDAGFSKVDVYWEGTDEETGEGDGEWQVATSAASDPSWIAYIVATR